MSMKNLYFKTVVISSRMDFRMLISIKNQFKTTIYLPINVQKGVNFFFKCSSKNFNLDFLKISFCIFQISKCYNSSWNWGIETSFFLNACRYLHYEIWITFSDFVYDFSDCIAYSRNRRSNSRSHDAYFFLAFWQHWHDKILHMYSR